MSRPFSASSGAPAGGSRVYRQAEEQIHPLSCECQLADLRAANAEITGLLMAATRDAALILAANAALADKTYSMRRQRDAARQALREAGEALADDQPFLAATLRAQAEGGQG